MSDTSPTATATITDTGAKPEIVPAVPTPKPTIASPDKIKANILAKIEAANKPAPVIPVQDKTGTEPAKGGEIVPDGKAALAELAKAHERIRELTAKDKLADSATADAAFAKELKELAAKDKLGAVLKLFGGSAEDVLAELVEKHYEGQAGAGTEQGKNTPAAAPAEMKAILDKLEAVTKELAEIKGGTAAKTEAEQKAQLAAQEQGTKAYLRSIAEKHKDMFEISSRAENMDEAVGKAIAKTQDPAWAAEKCKELGITDPAKLTPEQAEAFARAAISEAEKEFEQLGSRFAKVRKPDHDSDRVYQRPFSPPAIKFSPKPAKETFEEYKARLNKEWEAQNG